MRTIDEMFDEKQRLEKEISELLIKSWLNDSNRFNISQIRLYHLEAIVPSKYPALIGATIEVNI